ncbi:MAG: hypothetical protein RLZZ387_81 [Chloroflexota bacterium]|jgi:hypothetical protein
MKTNYVLIDYENVQPSALAALDQEHFQVLVFVGAQQTKIAIDVATALQPLGSRAQYVRIASSGANALDFHIAFYIGQLAAREPDAYFHIISGDTGFDPLIQHLKSRHILASRSRDVAEIPLVRAAQATSRDEKLAVIVTNLQQRGTAKPRTVATLSRTIDALFQHRLPEPEVAALVLSLRAQGVISIADTKVSYLSAGEHATVTV